MCQTMARMMRCARRSGSVVTVIIAPVMDRGAAKASLRPPAKSNYGCDAKAKTMAIAPGEPGPRRVRGLHWNPETSRLGSLQAQVWNNGPPMRRRVPRSRKWIKGRSGNQGQEDYTSCSGTCNGTVSHCFPGRTTGLANNSFRPLYPTAWQPGSGAQPLTAACCDDLSSAAARPATSSCRRPPAPPNAFQRGH